METIYTHDGAFGALRGRVSAVFEMAQFVNLNDC